MYLYTTRQLQQQVKVLQCTNKLLTSSASDEEELFCSWGCTGGCQQLQQVQHCWLEANGLFQLLQIFAAALKAQPS